MKKFGLILLVLMITMSLFTYVGCGDNSDVSIESGKEDSTSTPSIEDTDSPFNTIALMQENAMGTCFKQLNEIFKKSINNIDESLDVNNIIWTIEHDGDKTITQITARYVLTTLGEKGEVENLHVSTSKTPMEVGKFLAGKYAAKNLNFSSSSGNIPFLVETTKANEVISKAVMSKLNINEEDCKFIFTKIKEGEQNRQVVTLIETKCEKYFVKVDVNMEDIEPSIIAEKISDGRYEILKENIRKTIYGTIYVDKDSVNK